MTWKQITTTPTPTPHPPPSPTPTDFALSCLQYNFTFQWPENKLHQSYVTWIPWRPNDGRIECWFNMFTTEKTQRIYIVDRLRRKSNGEWILTKDQHGRNCLHVMTSSLLRLRAIFQSSLWGNWPELPEEFWSYYVHIMTRINMGEVWLLFASSDEDPDHKWRHSMPGTIEFCGVTRCIS